MSNYKAIFKEQLGVEFCIPDNIMRAQFPFTSPTGQQKMIIKWKVRQEIFRIVINEYDIRKKCLEIKVNRKNNTEIKFNRKKNTEMQKIKINLYQILKGPVKNNFKIKSDQDKYINLTFDLRLSQVLKPQIKVTKTQLSLKNQFPGEKFNFTLQFILSQNGKNNRKLSTLPSSSFQMPLQNESIIQEIQENPASPLKFRHNLMRKKTLRAKKPLYTSLTWTQSDYLPQISFNLTVQQLNSSLFMFHCWRLSNHTSQDKQVMHRFANYRMTLHQLLEEQQVTYRGAIRTPDFKIIKIQQELWSNGSIIGHCKTQIQIKIPKYLKQLQGWTRTQRGTVNTLMGELAADRESVYLKSFQKLIKLHQRLLLIKLKLAQKIESYLRRRQIYEQGQQIIREISKNLQSIDLQSHVNYRMDKLKQLSQKQCNLLQMMNTTFSLLKQPDNNFVEECWKLLIVFVKRGEFQLKKIGFPKQELMEISSCLGPQNTDTNSILHKQKANYHQLLKKKIKIALQFQKLLFNCLIVSLSKVPYMTEQGQNRTEYCQEFKGYCFLRIPIFRQYVLNSIFRDDDLDYSQFEIKEREWLKSKVEIKEKQMELFEQLQWDHYFYKALSFHSQSQEIYDQLVDQMQTCLWIEEIQKRGVLFFQFFKIVMLKFEHIQTRLKIPKYQYFAGYNKLVTSFLNVMKNTPLKRYPISLIRSSMVLLHNEQLYEPILLIIAKKTNYYDTNLVVKCLSLYKLYIKYLTQGNKNLPLSFCYGTFIKIIKRILESDAVYCVAAMLMLIYECYDKFQMQFQSYLTIYFLGSKFVPLFYHWSYLVRSIFHHFFILKIAQNRRIFFNKDFKIHTKLYATYQKVLDQLEQIKKANESFSHKRLRQMEHDKHYYLKMKHKIWKRTENQHNIDQAFEEIQNNQGKRIMSVQEIRSGITIQQNNNNRNIINLPFLQNNITKSEIFDYKKRQEVASLHPKRSDSIILIKSQTLLSQDDLPAQMPLIHQSHKKYTYHESAKYHGAFKQQQFNLPQFTQRQKNQIQIAHIEFDHINSEIMKKYIQTQKLPHIPLANQVAFDEHDLKPEDIEFVNF